MQFNSHTFVVFFLIVYSLYLLLRKNLRGQNTVLLIGSLVFYGWWDYRFLSLIAFSTVADWLIGRKLGETEDERRRRRLVTFSIVLNLTFLGIFKYFNFFDDSFARLLNAFGIHAKPLDLKIALPVGISFYTFQSLSYTIDVYRRHLKPERRLDDFALFVTFFPQLVAGPIERATHLLPQVQRPRTIRVEQVNAGIFLILWGYYKKVVITDNVAAVANTVFNGYTGFHGLDLFLGVLAFAFQIYCDFSAYSDIARGTAKLMGFDLMINFRLPYFAATPSDFWQRWHISLSTWLRDYLYIPLGGNRKGSVRTMFNLAATMLLGGLWHGANWTFVIWGAFHGAILIIYRFFERKGEPRDHAASIAGRAGLAARIVVMFVLTLIGWMIFRSQSVAQLWHFVSQMGFSISPQSSGFAYTLAYFILPFMVVEIWQQKTSDLLIPTKLPMVPRVLFYGLLLVAIFVLGVRESVEFIYFQF